MSSLVDPSLSNSAKLCGDNIAEFSSAIESLLIKHGKKIVHEQFVLNRLADATIDIYAMACVLSRASRSIKMKLPTAEHEKLMAEAWCVDASDRVKSNLRKTHSSDFIENYKRMSVISKNVCEIQGVVQSNPLGV